MQRLIALFAALALSACIPSGKNERIRSSDSISHGEADARQCLGALQSARVGFQPLPNKDYGGGCHARNAVMLTDLGIPTSNLGPMTCNLAHGFTRWGREVVAPAARKYLGSRIARIETSGTYSCRRVNGSGNLSQHAYANAVDVFAFQLENGRRISVLNGWNGKNDEQKFLKAIHKDACGMFGTVLGPLYNRDHANHFHLDMSPARVGVAPYCR